LLDDASLFNDQNTLEVEGVSDVVCNAEQSCTREVRAGVCEETPPLLTIQAAGGLIKNGQANIRTRQTAAYTDSLSLTAGYQRAAFPKRGLQTIGQLLQDIR